jgi:hypothetical protein
VGNHLTQERVVAMLSGFFGALALFRRFIRRLAAGPSRVTDRSCARAESELNS